MSGRAALALRATLYGSGFVVLWTWLATLVRPLDARLGFELPRWLQPVGIVIGGAGAVLALWCVLLFVTTGRGTPAPFDPPREVVVRGPYRHVRNPMYVGGIGVIAGAALVLRSPTLLGLAAVFLGLAHLFVILYEEPALERRFGASYLAYRRAVRRWVPATGRERSGKI
jgi:protein-S-isoprenylcysteine O-methyltransferase Ste14